MNEEEIESQEIEHGTPTWMCTFADLMSLLLCFFVLLLSFSEMDAAKYKQVAGSLEKAFGLDKEDPTMGSNGGCIITSSSFPRPMVDVQSKIMDAVAGEVSTGIIDAEPEPFGIIITIKDQIAFDSGKAKLKKTFTPILDKLGETFSKRPEIGVIIVSGHTDNIPINKNKSDFNSNWTLSSARAVAIVEYLTENFKIPSHQLKAVGHADGKPIKKNNTRKNRAYNRRVEINIRAQNLPPAIFAP
jgi:chemotaxis protein MotB